MSKQSKIIKYINKKNRKENFDKIIELILDIMLYPLRIAYREYEKSNLKTKRDIKKAYRKLKNTIYNRISDEETDNTYITDFWLNEEHESYNIISIYDVGSNIKYHTGKSIETIFDEMTSMIMEDKNLQIRPYAIKDLFEFDYGYYLKHNGRIMQISLINKK